MCDGKLYLYDGNLENPFVVRQFQTLGASRCNTMFRAKIVVDVKPEKENTFNFQIE